MSRKNATAKKTTTIATDFNQTGQLDIKKKIKDIKQKLQNNKSEATIPQAFKELSEICNKDTEYHEAFYLRGTCYNIMGDFQRALFDFSVAIRIAKEQSEKEKGNDSVTNKMIAEYLNMAGVQHQELGQLDEALEHFNAAIGKDKEVGSYYFNRGIVYSRKNEVESAIRDYDKALNFLTEPEHQY